MANANGPIKYWTAHANTIGLSVMRGTTSGQLSMSALFAAYQTTFGTAHRVNHDSKPAIFRRRLARVVGSRFATSAEIVYRQRGRDKESTHTNDRASFLPIGAASELASEG